MNHFIKLRSLDQKDKDIIIIKNGRNQKESILKNKVKLYIKSKLYISKKFIHRTKRWKQKSKNILKGENLSFLPQKERLRTLYKK